MTVTATASTSARTTPPAMPEVRETIVSARSLTKSFAVRRTWRELVRSPFGRSERATVVNDVSFDVQQGEFFGLLGANGAGKTTLFRILAARLLPDAGTAIVAGTDVVRDPARTRSLLTPVVTDERSLHWRLSARENLELFAALFGLRGSAATARVDYLLRSVELDDTGDKMVGTFSSGMKQRLLIARALLGQPRVLLLDEPTRSLDPISARRFRQFLKDEITGRQGCTVLLATHSAEEAFDLCERVAILDRGRMVASGRVSELAAQVSDDRFQVAIRADQAATLRSLLAREGVECIERGTDETVGAWARYDLLVPGGADGAAALLSRITREGIAVSQFQQMELTLADLIERVVQKKRLTLHV